MCAKNGIVTQASCFKYHYIDVLSSLSDLVGNESDALYGGGRSALG